MLRVGLRLAARVPWRLVSGVETVSWSTPRERRREHADVARPGDADLVIRFDEPVVVRARSGLGVAPRASRSAWTIRMGCARRSSERRHRTAR